MAAPASAAPQDAAFLQRLSASGITYENAYGIVLYAHKVCRALHLGMSVDSVVDNVFTESPALADRESAADYVVIAYMTYCPSHST